MASKFSSKIQGAAAMVDKMSKFSRNFIAVHSINSVFTKKNQKVLQKKFMEWKYLCEKAKITENSQVSSKSQLDAESKILEAYKASAEKLELIESKYSAENQKLRQQLEKALDDLQSKSNELKKANKTVKNLENLLNNQVNEAICPKCSESLEESMVLSHRAMNEVDTDRINRIEAELQKKAQELNNVFKHLEEKNHNERMYQHELNNKGQYILQLEKEKFTLVNETKQLRIDRSNFLSQLKELQESIAEIKKSTTSEKLMHDAYIQVNPKTTSTSTQSTQITSLTKSPSSPSLIPTKPSTSKPTDPKKKPLTKKPSKKSIKRPSSKLSFCRNQSTPITSTPSQINTSTVETEPSFSYTPGGSRDTETLSNEIILLNREVNSLKSQLRISKG